MFNKLATLLIAFVFFWGHISAFASDPPTAWSKRWDANVWNNYCELKLDYEIPFRKHVERRGFLANTGYDKAFVRFTAMTGTHYGLYPEAELSRIKFQLSVYGENGELPPPIDRVASAKIGDFELHQPNDAKYGIHTFLLDEEATSTLLDIFRANERVDVVVRLASGDERVSTIYPSGDRDFHVWEAMFNTCIDKNIAR